MAAALASPTHGAPGLVPAPPTPARRAVAHRTTLRASSAQPHPVAALQINDLLRSRRAPPYRPRWPPPILRPVATNPAPLAAREGPSRTGCPRGDSEPETSNPPLGGGFASGFAVGFR